MLITPCANAQAAIGSEVTLSNQFLNASESCCRSLSDHSRIVIRVEATTPAAIETALAADTFP